MKVEHDFNQCANDWITCKCGKLFGDTKTKMAKDIFLDHLLENEVKMKRILELEFMIRKMERKNG